jgi:hypothetical protein
MLAHPLKSMAGQWIVTAPIDAGDFPWQNTVAKLPFGAIASLASMRF